MTSRTCRACRSASSPSWSSPNGSLTAAALVRPVRRLRRARRRRRGDRAAAAQPAVRRAAAAAASGADRDRDRHGQAGHAPARRVADAERGRLTCARPGSPRSCSRLRSCCSSPCSTGCTCPAAACPTWCCPGRRRWRWPTGPVPGMVTGFAAGLCLDLAPPGSAADRSVRAGLLPGRLGGRAAEPRRQAGRRCGARARGRRGRARPRRSRPDSACCWSRRRSRTAEIRAGPARHDRLRPAALPVRAVPGRAGRRRLATTAWPAPGWPPRAERAAGRAGPVQACGAAQHRPPSPGWAAAAARTGDGWVGGGPASRGGHRRAAARAGQARRAAAPWRRRRRIGVGPGAPSGTGPRLPVNLRLGAARRGDGAIGNAVGGGQLSAGSPAGIPARWRAAGGGSARTPASSAARPRGSTAARPGLAAAPGEDQLRRAPRRCERRPPLGTSWLSEASRGSGPGRGCGWAPAGLRLRSGRARRAAGAATAASAARSPPVARRPAAAPKFRRGSPAAPVRRRSTGLVGGGVLDQRTFRARRGAARRAAAAAGRGRRRGDARRLRPQRAAAPAGQDRQAAAVRLRPAVAAVVPDRPA